jgi:hypothetical protein
MKHVHRTVSRRKFGIATATITEEIRQLGQVGFVKYDELNGIHFYRKLKRFGVYSNVESP